MTLNASEPVDTRQVNELAVYIREVRAAVNALTGSGNIVATDLTVPAGTTSLSVGTELSDAGLEIVIVTGSGLSDLATILGGTEGQIKIFIFQDSNVDIVDGNIKLNGAFYLNHLPAGSDFEPDQDDILAVVNINGDGASVYGYWKELLRTLSVK